MTNHERMDIASAVWKDWMPKALENGSLKCKPDALVVGQGLEKLQDAFDRGSSSVSAQKLVVQLS